MIPAFPPSVKLDIKNPETRRVRCLGHIINLAAKALLFGEDVDALELTTQRPRAWPPGGPARELV